MSQPQTVDSSNQPDPARALACARDQALYPVVWRYREDPSPANAEAILAFVGETLRGRANRYKPVAPLISRSDIRQELMAAVLETAATMPLSGPDFLERRLMLRAGNRMSRALYREAQVQARFVDLDSLESDEEEEDCDGA